MESAEAEAAEELGPCRPKAANQSGHAGRGSAEAESAARRGPRTPKAEKQRCQDDR